MPPMPPSSSRAALSLTSIARGPRACAAMTCSRCTWTAPMARQWRACRKWSKQRMATPKPVWNPDVKQPIDFYDGWQVVPDTQSVDNGFKVQWEAFIRHVAEGTPYSWNLLEGAKGVQLVECALRSWKERRWVDVPE